MGSKRFDGIESIYTVGEKSLAAADSNTISFGSPKKFSDQGYVQIYKWINGNWVQKGSDIVGSGTDNIGRNLTMLDSNTIAFVSNNSINSNVRVYKWNGLNWVKVGQDIDDLALSNFAWDGGLGKNLILKDDNTLIYLLHTVTGLVVTVVFINTIWFQAIGL